MASTIAHLGQVTDSLDTAAKLFRVLGNDGVSLERIVHPINNFEARGHLVAFLNAGCPAFAVPDAASAPVVEKSSTLVFVKQTMLGSASITTYGLGKRLTIAQMLRALMKLVDDAPLDVIEKLVKERKHLLTEAQYEEMLKSQAKFFLKQKGGKDFGLRDDGWANLVLVQYPDGTVSVAGADWNGDRWLRYRRSLAAAGVWRADNRLVASNSETLNL